MMRSRLVWSGTHCKLSGLLNMFTNKKDKNSKTKLTLVNAKKALAKGFTCLQISLFSFLNLKCIDIIKNKRDT
jgi:hypothetical protein